MSSALAAASGDETPKKSQKPVLGWASWVILLMRSQTWPKSRRAVQLICLGLAQCKDWPRAVSDQELPDITDDEHRQDRPQREQGCIEQRHCDIVPESQAISRPTS
jgi:hypothetical protein